MLFFRLGPGNEADFSEFASLLHFGSLDVDLVKIALNSYTDCICVLSGQVTEYYGKKKFYCRICNMTFRFDFTSRYRCALSVKAIIQSAADIPSSHEDLAAFLRAVLGHIFLSEEDVVDLLEGSFFIAFHESLECRKQYSMCLGMMASLAPSDRFVTSIKEQLANLQENDASHHSNESLLHYFAELTKHAHGALYEHAVVRLSIFTLARPPSDRLSELAERMMQETCRIRGCSLRRLFDEFAGSLMKYIVLLMCQMVQLHPENTDAEIGTLLLHAAQLFEFRDQQQRLSASYFLRKNLHHVLPWLMMERTADASRVHIIIAKMLGTNRHCLLAAHFRYVLLTVTMSNLNNDSMQEVFNFVEQEGKVEPREEKSEQKWTISTYLSWDLYSCIYELLLHLAEREERVFQMLKYIISNFTGSDQASPKSDNDSGVIEFIKPRILGVLIKFDERFRNRGPLREKIIAISSLNKLIALCAGKILDEVKSKLLSTLRSANSIADAECRRLCCDAWYTFVTGLTPDALKDFVLTIFAAIWPLIEADIPQVANILEFIFRTKRMLLNRELEDIKFLIISCKSNVLTSCVSWLPSLSPPSLVDMLFQCIRLIRADSSEIKRLSLARLNVVLKENQLAIQELILSGEAVDPIIRELHSELLLCVRHTDAVVKQLSSISLGALGAIEPGRLGSSIQEERSVSRTVLPFADFNTESNSEFARVVIIELAKYLSSASDGFVYDACSCAIQETLKFFRCQQDRDVSHTMANVLWSELPPNVKLLISPFLSTSYRFRNRHPVKIDSHPIFGSRCGDSLSTWLRHWLTYLVEKVKHPKASRFYRMVSIIVDSEISFAPFLLPHVILQKAFENDYAEISNEVLAVLRYQSKANTADEVFQRAAVQVIFSVVDFLQKWANAAWDWPRFAEQRAFVVEFLGSLPKDLLAERAVLCRDYTRALVYYEAYITDLQDSGTDTDAHWFYLQKLYGYVEESDAVKGLLTLRRHVGQPTLQQYILAYETYGNYNDALPFHESITASNPDDVGSRIAFVQCLLKLNQLNVCRRYVDGLVVDRPDWSEQLHSCRVETLCRLQDWGALDVELKRLPESFGWSADVGRLMLIASKQNLEDFRIAVAPVRSRIAEEMSVAFLSSDSYELVYQHVLKLHQLHEIERVVELSISLEREDLTSVLSDLSTAWNNRLKLMQSSPECQTPVLELRRQLLDFLPECSVTLDLRDTSWLQSAKVARRAGYLHSAWSNLAQVKGKRLHAVFTEEAKLLWLKNQQEEALDCLDHGIRSKFGLISVSPNQKMAEEDVRLYRKAQLLLANYARQSASRETHQVVEMYKQLIAVCSNSEKAYYHAAVHLDQVVHTLSYRSSYHKVLPQMVNFYGKSLSYGTKFLHHSLPRLLTLWLDSTAKLSQKQPTRKGERDSDSSMGDSQKQELVVQLNKSVLKLSDDLPVFLFYSCFSQLISRICHPCESTADLLKTMLARIVAAYPQQGLWMSMAVARSSVPQRRQACWQMLERATTLNGDVKLQFETMKNFVELLVRLCEYVASLRCMSLSMSNSSPVLLPLQSTMEFVIPLLKQSPTPASVTPPHALFINGFADQIEVLNSLQKPKKISIVGSDGHNYPMMCKNKDDLRLDKRLMEFNNLVNTCLLREPECRRRRMRVRTYTVTPIGEDCGLVEWVNNLEPLRQTMLQIYKSTGTVMTVRELQMTMAKKSDSLAKKLIIFNEKLLPRHPAKLGLWFRLRFPEPTVWYQNRLNFTRTCAVMSMVGYVLGLGDRHGENILLDSNSGEVVHVDFNCLFNRGEDLEWPELIPFRLTHNMVQAMGPLGYEGSFRKCCELTMRILREQRSMLRSVLETFLYDPLVEWTRNPSNKFRPSAGEDKAREHLQSIETRLKGSVRTSLDSAYGLPLSIEGQVAHLISQATDKKLLAQMYVGWAPFI
ncbi:FATC domain protein [Trichuris suis]|nr:FATC domain protein [Trichuris suis]